MAGQQGQRVIDVLEADGPTLPLVVIARRLSVPPSRLARVLDDLYDEGLVTPGLERGTVALVPQPQQDGRFIRQASGRDDRSTRAR
jgi:DNA-binding IclR family transcriptional regulator